MALLLTVLALAGGAVVLMNRLNEASADQARFAEAREAAAAAASRPPEVDVATPVPATHTPVVVLTGTLEPVRAADLSFELPGRISRVDVSLGQTVAPNQTLLALDRASLGAQSAQSEAAISVAQANAEMMRDRVTLLEGLVRTGAAPERDLTTARQQLAVVEAQLGQAQASRRQIATASADHVLRAPFAGVVTRAPSGVGGFAGPGVPIARVEDLSALRLRTTVSQSDLEVLRVGATVTLDGHEGVTGEVRSAVRSLDPQTRRAPVEVFVPNADGRLVANAFVRARIVVGQPRPALRIPATSRRPNGSVLVVTGSGHVEARTIEAVAEENGDWLVTSGLAPDERVLVRPAAAREGQLVAVRTSDARTP